MPTSSHEAYTRIRDWILDGTLPMGGRLGEVELAASLGVSRTPVREALRRLKADGLVDLQANRGARVSSWSTEELDDIHELRVLLEGQAAARAARQITQDEILELRELCLQMERAAAAKELEVLTATNGVFHAKIVTCSRSHRLPSIYSSVIQVPVTFRTFSQYSDVALERSMHHHREIVDALDARDPGWAKVAMEGHILAARHQIRSWAERDASELDRTADE